MRCQQIALDTLGDEDQRFSARSLALALQASGNPGGQLRKIWRYQLDHHARFGERLEPSCLFFGPIKPRQGNQQHGIRRWPRAIRLKRGTAFTPRFARRDTQVDEFSTAKQGHIARRRAEFIPVEPGHRGQYLTVGKALSSCRTPDHVRRFDNQ